MSAHLKLRLDHSQACWFETRTGFHGCNAFQAFRVVAQQCNDKPGFVLVQPPIANLHELSDLDACHLAARPCNPRGLGP